MLFVAICGCMLSFAIVSCIVLQIVVICWCRLVLLDTTCGCVLSLCDYRCYTVPWVVATCSRMLQNEASKLHQDVISCSRMFTVAVWCFMLFYDIICCCQSHCAAGCCQPMLSSAVGWCNLLKMSAVQGHIWCCKLHQDVTSCSRVFRVALWCCMLFHDINWCC